MANSRRSAGSFSAPRGTGVKPMGIQGIMPFISQQAQMDTMANRSEAQQLSMPGAVPIGGTNPFTGTQTKTQQGQQFEAQGNLRNKSLENAKSAALAMTILNQSEGSYRKIFGDIIDKGGPEGQAEVSKRYMTGVIGKQNPELTAFVNDLPNQVSFFQRASQETGNIALQKELRGGRALPHIKPMEGGPENLFMSDDPKTALAKFDWLRNQFTNIYKQNMDQYQTGQVSLPQLDPNTPSMNSPIPGMQNGQQQSSGKIRVRDKVSKQTGTVSESSFDPNKYERI